MYQKVGDNPVKLNDISIKVVVCPPKKARRTGSRWKIIFYRNIRGRKNSFFLLSLIIQQQSQKNSGETYFGSHGLTAFSNDSISFMEDTDMRRVFRDYEIINNLGKEQDYLCRCLVLLRKRRSKMNMRDSEYRNCLESGWLDSSIFDILKDVYKVGKSCYCTILRAPAAQSLQDLNIMLQSSWPG